MLEIVNTSDHRARRITLVLSHDFNDVSHYLLSLVPMSIAARGRAEIVLSTEPGPQVVDISLQWEDDAGIPGTYHSIASRY